jgi:2-iminobutanoate/2-iminopropanoate deaminase
MKYLLIAALFTATLPALAQKRFIHPPEFPGGNTSPGVLAGNTLYIAGQTGFDKANKLPDSFEVELRQTLDKIGLVLKAADMNFSDVVNVTVYLSDMSMLEKTNEVYATYFKTNPPARVVLQVAGLVRGAHVAIAAVATK